MLKIISGFIVIFFIQVVSKSANGMLVKSFSLPIQQNLNFHSKADSHSRWQNDALSGDLSFEPSLKVVRKIYLSFSHKVFFLFFRRVLCTFTPAYPSSCPSSLRTSIQSTSGQTNTFFHRALQRQFRVPDPWHFGTYPDPRVPTSD